MSNFVPLNVEIESESEDEIDDSKEIQIEEALKLYQNALKFHSQGPGSYAEAEAAYKELFSSEIFSWEESLSEAQRLDRETDLDGSDDEAGGNLTPVFTTATAGADGSPSSLPQILYLAYKNHGQFLLDRLKHDLSRIEDEILSKPLPSTAQKVPSMALSSLKLFVEALDRDDSDLELWRLVSRIGGLLGSPRIARFCLETVLDNDQVDLSAWTEPLGLEEGFAEEQLKPILDELDDLLSKSQMSQLYSRQKAIVAAFRQYIDPCPYLPSPPPKLHGDNAKAVAKPQVIEAPHRSWSRYGECLLLRLNHEAQGTIESDPGATYSITFPADQPDTHFALETQNIMNEEGFIQASRQLAAANGEDVPEEIPKSATTEGEAPTNQVLPEAFQESPVERNHPPLDESFQGPKDLEGDDNREKEDAAKADGAEMQGDGVEGIPTLTSAVSLPNRKRSSETAELPDGNDVGRTKSKRIKARGSLDPGSLKDSTAEDWARWFEQQLQIYHQADDSAFASTGTILSTFMSEESVSLQTLRDIVSIKRSDSEPEDKFKSLGLVAYDLKCALDGWDTEKSRAFLNGHDQKDPAGGIGGNRGPGFAAFVDTSAQESKKASGLKPLPDSYGLSDFEHHVNMQSYISLNQVAYRWLDGLLSFRVDDQIHAERQTLYESYLWPDILKQNVVQMLVYQDHAVHSELARLIKYTEHRDQSEVKPTHTLDTRGGLRLWMNDVDEAKRKYTNLAQTIFELHLDVYGRITNPSSKVDESTRILQRERLCRWFALASKLMNQWSWPGYRDDQWSKTSSELQIRFLWASVVCKGLLDPTSRDDTILCYKDLIQVLQDFFHKQDSSVSQVIELPNNAIMPEISVSIAEKEISRLSTMDFFMGIFDHDTSDPINLIESLEPLLDLSVNRAGSYINQNDETNPQIDTEHNSSSPRSGNSDIIITSGSRPQLLEALQFLEQGSLPLRLFLWQKLRDAYRAVPYPPQVLCCDLRMATLIIDHLASSFHAGKSPRHRRDSLLRWLHRLDDHITRVLGIALHKTDPFECVDDDHIREALQSLLSIQKVVHCFALWEDTIRVGKTPPPAQATQGAVRGLAKSTDKFRDMIVKVWTLQYILLKEAMAQHAAIFTSQDQRLVAHLQQVHQVLGLRCYCSLAGKMFLRLMKNELETFKLGVGDWDTNMSQLIFDLYGVKISSSPMEMQDHGCLTEDLDKCTALEIMDLVMTQVNRISTKDLLKSDLKFTVDKMQQVIKIPPISRSLSRTFNFRLVNVYLKSPLNPYDLYQSLRGIGGLCDNQVCDEGSEVASKGWYYLLGNISLARFRSLKRSSAGSADDLSTAKTFLRYDLEFGTNRWETWYRLGQVFDAQIEEDTTWTSEKLENQTDHLPDLQRKAIHCYSMAIAVATQYAEGSFEDTSKIADLCADFGTRVYASTREPFSMKAFDLSEYKRHYNSQEAGMYQGLPFTGMHLYSAWKFASILLRRASVQKPHNWVISYNYGKVLWKMHSCGDEVRGSAKRIGYQPVIDAFVRAIEACPEKRDNRHPEKDPILEPHYKLLSVVHKLVKSQRIPTEEACRILKATPFSAKAPNLQESGDWNGYVWQILKALRAADKANWHHRMVARAAHILYDDEPNDPRSALGAKHELNQQMFTKSMAIQVWKPDNERPGRHFVYTSRYVRFFTRLLYQLNDKISLEAMTRRIRKRSGDFLNHIGVWEEVCRAYLKLLHHQPDCPVKDGFSELLVQGMDPEGFQLHAARLEQYVHERQTPPPMLDILREAIELKKLNGNLFKPITPFEDLIRDAYAHLYDSIVPSLVAKDAAEERRIRMSLENILTSPTPAATETPPPDAGGEQPKKSGARYVTQREVVRKAEAIVAKPAPKIPAKTLKPLAPAPAGEQDARPSSNTPKVAVVINIDGTHDAGSSAPGSVHDSADDESELSEVDDEVAEGGAGLVGNGVPVRRPLFPGLLGATASNPEEIEGDSGDEGGGEVGDEGEVEEVEGDDEVGVEEVKESGVHQGSW